VTPTTQAPRKAPKAEAGWPTKWRPAFVERWQKAGGSRDQAHQIADNGWSQKDAAELIAASSLGPNLDVPSGPASLHRAHNDTLLELCSGRCMPVPVGTVVSVRRCHRSGRRDRWGVRSVDSRWFVWRGRRAREGWGYAETEVAETELATVIRAVPALRKLRSGTSSEWMTMEADHCPAA